MPSFTPPTDLFVSFASRYETGIMAALRPFPRGRNVYKLVDGSFTENQPSDPAKIDKIYHGGHIHPLTAEEEADLTAAGYGAYIS